MLDPIGANQDPVGVDKPESREYAEFSWNYKYLPGSAINFSVKICLSGSIKVKHIISRLVKAQQKFTIGLIS